MHTYLISSFSSKVAANTVFIKVMVFVSCLVVLWSGVMLLNVSKAQAMVKGTSVKSPTMTTSPATVVARDNNQWNFQFTATSALKIDHSITVEFPEGFSINSPSVQVNGVAISRVSINSGKQLQIWLANNNIPAGSIVKLVIEAGEILNPPGPTRDSIKLWTSADTDPVIIPVTVEASSLSVSLGNKYEGARNVSYKLEFKARQKIDPANTLELGISDELADFSSMDTSKVLLNGVPVSRISPDGSIFIDPGPGTSIAEGEPVTLEFTKEAGLSNPVFESGVPLTKKIAVGFANHYDRADITYLEDDMAPTGSIAVSGITASGTTFSRSILLDLSANDEGSGVVERYEVSETDSFDGQKILDYKSQDKFQVPYVLSPGAGSKTIYVKYYDRANNQGVAGKVTVTYDDKLSLRSLTVKDENAANVALSPVFSDVQSSYDAVVNSSVNTVKINLAKSAAADIVLEDSRAVYTSTGTDSSSGEITFSKLAFGSNDLKIKVAAGKDYLDYHLVIFKEGPVLKHSNNTTVISNGSIISLGEKSWILTDKDKRQLTLLEAYTGCASSDPGNCAWDGTRSIWGTEGGSDGYLFDPQRNGSVAYHLNNAFLNSIKTGRDLISLYPFDNTTYSKETKPVRWSTEERRVMAAVGLLSIPQYQSLGAGVLDRLKGSNWFLMNPAHAGNNYYMYSVDFDGNLAADEGNKNVLPVVYLKPNVSIGSGSGTEKDPYTLARLSSNANIESIQYENKALDYSGTSKPPVYSLVVSAEHMNAELAVTMTDPTASIVVDSIEQPFWGGVQTFVTGKTIQVSGLTTGDTTLRIYGLAADQITKSYYNVKLMKKASASMQNAILSSLEVQGATISPDTYKNLTASVLNSVYATTVTGAVYQGTKMTIAIGPPGTGIATTFNKNYPVSLNEGINVFTIVVTAPDGTATQTYTLTITRAPSGSSGGLQQDVAVTATLPIATLTDGTKINFAGSTFGPGAKVSVTEVIPLHTGGTLTPAGKTLEFITEGIRIDSLRPVKVSIRINANVNLSRVGIFYYNPTTQGWEYQKTEVDPAARTATIFVTHFSTYGVFEAEKVGTPAQNEFYYTTDTTRQVTLSTPTAGAAIYYTLDGSTPTTASNLYHASSKPQLPSEQTLKTIAVKNGMITSDTASFVGTARKTIANVLTSILNKIDQNGDNQFDQIDVRALLDQVEPFRAK